MVNTALETYTETDYAPLREMANAIRALAMEAVEKANSGHPGMPMGMADVATLLYTKYLKFDPKNPTWFDRDRLILSGGHGSMLLYSLLYLTGYEDMTLDQIKNFRQLHSLAAGHPEIAQHAGIEMTTGPLGQGIASSVGFALAEEMLKARFGEDMVNHKTFVFCGDGDLMEGISHEACSLAGHLGLSKLVVLYDDNGISIDGKTDLSFSDDTVKRFESYGWKTLHADGHDFESIDRALEKAVSETERPTLIACKTRIGFGAPTKENTSSAHGAPLGEDEIKGAKEALKWPYEAFEIPEEILSQWRALGHKGHHLYQEWCERFDAQEEEVKESFALHLNPSVSTLIKEPVQDFIKSCLKNPTEIATRKASGEVLKVLVDALPQLVGGSADLTGSNITKVQDTHIQKEDFSGSYIYYGVREHAMAAIMNGFTLHGGLIPYAGTFLCFSDYSRPSIRLAALMKLRVIHVMTHDSIGLGEDGPTHQPVEHLSALRAIPNCYTFRPADLIETAESWEMALNLEQAPSLLSLTRQNLPAVRLEETTENMTAKGGYVLREADNAHTITLFASGSEIEIALQAKDMLEEKGEGVRVISVPCLDLLLEQGDDYLSSLRGSAQKLCAIEAGCRQSWDRIIGFDGVFIGMDGFGESAPYDVLYQHFGITAENTVQKLS